MKSSSTTSTAATNNNCLPEDVWKNAKSTSVPSARHALAVESPADVVMTERVLAQVRSFYESHRGIIKASHGLTHVLAVYDHAAKAIARHTPLLETRVAMEIQLAALLHDVDDKKYFPSHSNLENARSILAQAEVSEESCEQVLAMIRLVSCSENGNHVPEFIIKHDRYHLLIPRWADRLEAVGAVGVVRCYQYNQEHDRPLSSPQSPRAQTITEVWHFATSGRFEQYQNRGGTSTDMISHFYDKLLHVACPPKQLVRNPYLESMAQESSKELVVVCLQFGKTGQVDEKYIQELAQRLSISGS